MTSPEARSFFKIPADFKKNYTKYTHISYGDGLTIGFAFVPLSKLKAAGVASDPGPHVKRMMKILKSGKKVPPIAVKITQNGTIEVDDGNTRVIALKLMRAIGKVPAVIVAWTPTGIQRLKSMETF